MPNSDTSHCTSALGSLQGWPDAWASASATLVRYSERKTVTTEVEKTWLAQS